MLGMGSVSDEAVLRDPKHLEHRSGWREARMAAVAVCLAGWIFFSVVEMPWLPFGGALALVLLLAFGAGWFFVRWIGGDSKCRMIEGAKAQRERDSAERKRKIEEAKASGAFDRFGK